MTPFGYEELLSVILTIMVVFMIGMGCGYQRRKWDEADENRAFLVRFHKKFPILRPMGEPSFTFGAAAAVEK